MSELAPGASLAHFRIDGRLGAGATGVVYRATDERLRRRVALKVLTERFDDDPERRARFLREARTAASLTHPNLATVFEIGEVEEGIFIAMELVDGESLRARLLRGPMSLGEVVRTARGIAHGLARAHDASVIHRDLKPENVIVAPDGTAKILDFGMAKQAGPPIASVAPDGQPSSLLTEEGRILGTPGYMSPEQAMGLVVDVRSDVYSFGVLLYEMVTGARPFRGTTMEQLLATVRDSPPAPTTASGRVPVPLERLIRECLAKRPEERPANGRALATAIDALGDHDLKPQRRSVRVGFTIAGISILLGVSAIVVASKRSHDAKPSVPPTPAAAMTITDQILPAGTPAAAVAAYRAGLQLERDGANAGAWDRYTDAAKHDPSLAQPHLRMAIAAARGYPSLARDHLARANELRASLGPRDRALLEAIGPCIRNETADSASCARRLARIADENPSDAELQELAAELHFNAGLLDEAVRLSSRALSLDPYFGSAAVGLGYAQAYLGRRDEALRTFERAASLTPTGYSVLTYRADLYAEDGQCELFASDAKRFVAAAPQLARAYAQLVDAYVATGQPMTTVREALRQQLQRTPDSERAMTEDETEMRLAALEGRFAVAERHARALLQRVDGSTTEADHAGPARLLVALYTETGRPREAATVAADFLARRGAWVADERGDDFAIGADPTLLFVAAELRDRRRTLASSVQAREAWFARWRHTSPAFYQRYLWIHGWAAPAETVDEARAAVAALEDPATIPAFRPLTLAAFDIGKTWLLAGRTDEALVELERAARHCAIAQHPFEAVRAHLFLGRAREAKGDRAGACTAYRAVMSRWGEASPPSRSAAEARARVRTLHCPNQSGGG